jgi:hypothetical protein
VGDVVSKIIETIHHDPEQPITVMRWRLQTLLKRHEISRTEGLELCVARRPLARQIAQTVRKVGKEWLCCEF